MGFSVRIDDRIHPSLALWRSCGFVALTWHTIKDVHT